MQETTIGFIGTGSMGSSLIGGLIADGYPPQKIVAHDHHPEQLQKLSAAFGIQVVNNSSAVAKQADVVVFSVKPQSMSKAISDVAEIITEKKLLTISVAAGVRIKSIASWIQSATPIVRCMPNTPALVGSGATGLFANDKTSDEQKNLAESILRAVGITVWLDDEKHLDIVTALSGSGPAYFFYVMEALEEAATQLGLDKKMAHLLTLQTALGAAHMAMESKQNTSELRRNVTSPGGTTERAVLQLEAGKMKELFFTAIKAAQERADEIANSF